MSRDSESVSQSLAARIERQRLIDRMRNLKKEIDQIFIDAESWNENVRKPNEAPIDPDPDGKLRRLQQRFGAALAKEDKRLQKRRTGRKGKT